MLLDSRVWTHHFPPEATISTALLMPLCQKDFSLPFPLLVNMLFAFMTVHVYCRAPNKASAPAELTGEGALAPQLCAHGFSFFVAVYPTLFPAFQEFVSLTGHVSVRMHPPVCCLCERTRARVCVACSVCVRCCTITPPLGAGEDSLTGLFSTNQPDSRGACQQSSAAPAPSH